MMNHTFISAQEEAVLEWRVLYARNLLKLEMLAEPFERLGWLHTHGGERLPDGRWCVRSPMSTAPCPQPHVPCLSLDALAPCLLALILALILR